jgi:hypothetical protein
MFWRYARAVVVFDLGNFAHTLLGLDARFTCLVHTTVP